MTRIKEILKEKGLGVAELAERLGVSRQALSRQIQGKMLVETAEKIASALDVPLWQLFISPEEFVRTGDSEVNGFVKIKGTVHEIHSFDDLEKLLELK